MIQEISNVDTFLTTAKNRSKTENINSDSFTEVFQNTQKKLTEKESILTDAAGVAPSDNKKTQNDVDLLEEFKSISKGLSICKTCGAIYRGTAVAKCAKCGHDMKEENDTVKKMQNASEMANVAKTSDTSMISAKLVKS